MKFFSERNGYKKARESFQLNSIDDQLKNRLWNVARNWILNSIYIDEFSRSFEPRSDCVELVEETWTAFIQKTLDSIPDRADHFLEVFRERFFAVNWDEVYSFLEMFAHYAPDHIATGFQKGINVALEKEMSGYRFVSTIISPITSEAELKAIDQAIQNSKNAGIKQHLQSALRKLSDRANPDFRNSIKESISAVESICILIAGQPKATLGQAISTIKKHNRVEFHGAFTKALEQMYGYTSDSAGIRHSLLDESQHSFEDASFMLVTCSAFINYMTAKSTKAGIRI